MIPLAALPQVLGHPPQLQFGIPGAQGHPMVRSTPFIHYN